MFYSGPEEYSYKCGGLVSIDLVKHTDLDLICESNSDKTSQTRNLYSQGSTMLLVVYWYDEYSTLNIKLRIAKTHCKAIYIDPCQFNKKCNFGSEASDNCRNYIGYLNSSSHVNIHPGTRKQNFWSQKTWPEHIMSMFLFKLSYKQLTAAVFHI